MSTEFERKYIESQRIREKFPERVPVIVGRAAGCSLNDIDKKKYLQKIIKTQIKTILKKLDFQVLLRN